MAGIGGYYKRMTDESPDTGTSAVETLDLNNLPPFLKANEVARILRRDHETVVRQARAGKLPGKKVVGEWLFNRDHILEMLPILPSPGSGVEPAAT